ncbi:hypothetical protein [Micromonospora sp. NBC_00421]|uniref:hypothetical protein n=1 Tax=Micromonospora sp. NBC_00421 TaxID=2975976 RepID=UPI002E24B058
MRRAVAITALAATLAGCSPDTSALESEPEPEPVEQIVSFTVEVVGGGGGPFGLSVTWGHTALEGQRAKSPTWAWAHMVTVSYPDVKDVWVMAAPEVRPGVDESLAYRNGAPQVHCRILVNGRTVAKQTSAAPQCDANLSATPPAAPTGTVG